MPPIDNLESAATAEFARRNASALGYTFGALGGGIRGYELGVVAGALLFAAPALHMTPLLTGWVVSSALLGSLFGALAAGPLADRIGRRKMVAVAAIVFSLGIIGAALAPDVVVMIAARLTLGVAVGIATAIIPVYISEIAPAKDRGSFTGLFQVMITIGVLASSIVTLLLTPYGAWRWMFAVGLLPAIVMLIGVVWLPESPRWLVTQGREEEARVVLQRIRDLHSVEPELAEIKRINQQEQDRIGLWSLILAPRLRRLLIIGAGLGSLQQMIGINAVTYYAPTVLKNIGFSNEQSIIANLGFSILGFIMTVVMALFVVDRFGRRKPLMFGALGMGASMAALGAVFQVSGATGSGGHIAIAALAMFQICFALSWGGIVWIVLGEMFPLNIRGTAVGLTVFLTEATSVVIGIAFPVLLTTGPATVFFGFAVMAVVAFLWAMFLIPETKGRSLEDIETDLVLGT